MKKYIVKLFAQSPFDKSEYIKDVQVLCDAETLKPYAHLNSPHNWEEETIDENEIELSWQSKKSKHLVVGDKVCFGGMKSFCGTIENIIPNTDGEDSWEDKFELINCYDELSENSLEGLRSMAENIEPKQTVLRKETACKNWLCAEIKNDNINWKKIEKDWNKFFEEKTRTKEEILSWWKTNVIPKKY